MPPYKPKHEVTQALEAKIQLAKDLNRITTSHLLAHKAIAERAQDIIDAYGSAVPHSYTGPVKATLWYENPSLREGNRKVAYRLAGGAYVRGFLVDTSTLTLHVKVSEPHPIASAQVLDQEAVIAYINIHATHILGEAALDGRGVCLSAAKGTQAPGHPWPLALNPDTSEFQDIIDTLDFITASAAAVKTFGASATSQVVSL